MDVGVKNILIGYDGFERNDAIPAIAVALAEEQGAQLHVIHVLPDAPRRSWGWAKDEVADELYEELVAERRNALEALLKPALDRGISVHIKMGSGTPHDEILQYASAIRADLLVVVDEPSRRGDGRGFGTVTKKLFRKCPCPVLAKRSHKKLTHSRILAAVDVGPVAPHEDPPNRRVVEMAASLARRGDGDLCVFHAWSLWNESFLRGRASLSESEIDQALEEEKSARQERLDELIASSDLDDVKVELELVKGDPRKTLLDVAEKRNIELVVMGTVSRGGILGLVIGNTAERILNELECSVLAIKPEDSEG